MDDRLWQFVDATGKWYAKSYGFPPMMGRVFAWLLVCDPPEQTAAEIGQAIGASKGSISSATRFLLGARLVDRLRVRGERADRFRIRPGAWTEQIQDPSVEQQRVLIAQGLECLADAPPARRARLEELDAFYAWYTSRIASLDEEWQQYKREHLENKRD